MNKTVGVLLAVAAVGFGAVHCGGKADGDPPPDAGPGGGPDRDEPAVVVDAGVDATVDASVDATVDAAVDANVDLQGIFFISWERVTPSTLAPGQPATFLYRLESGTNHRATWTLVPKITAEADAAIWNGGLRVRNASGVDLPSGQITLDPGEVVEVQVHLASVPANALGAQFALSLNVSADDIFNNSGRNYFTVGAAVPELDPEMSLWLVPAISRGALLEDTLTVSEAKGAKLGVLAKFTAPGTYEIAPAIFDSAPGWRIEREGGGSQVIIRSSDLIGGPVMRGLDSVVTASSEASAMAQARVHVQRQGSSTSRVIAVSLRRP